ncbi:cytochrome P450 [Gautieria morchelliformis]|nr:cytochrome P450 [Gautieria morchelliformis]
MSLMLNLQAFGLLLVVLVVWRISKKLTSEKSPLANVPGPAKEHWLKGNYHRIFQDGLQYNLQLAEKYGGAAKIHALLGDEQLYVSDPKALHYICVKEQHIYEETDMFIMGNRLIFGEGLISTLGEQHRKQRKILNPMFSLGNMRHLLPVTQPISDKLSSIISSQLPPDGETKEIDVLPLMSRGALEYIGQAALGHSFNALDTSRHDEYTEAVRNLGPTTLRLILFRPFIPVVVRNFSLYWRNKIMDWAPVPALRELRRIVGIMDSASKQILSETKNQIRKPGGLTLTRDHRLKQVRTHEESPETERLTESEILGQMNTFVFAGLETTAIAVTRLLHLLAKRPEVQARLRTEIRNAKQSHLSPTKHLDRDAWKAVELSYDELMALPYLDAIVRETLRVYPPTSLFGRTTRKATTLPLEYPIRSQSGALISSIALPANTNIIISLLAANHNKQVWGEDASVWRPERWLTSSGERMGLGKYIDGSPGGEQGGGEEGTPGNKNGMKYPGVYASIGFKFAEMEIKQILLTILSHVHLSLPASVDDNGHPKEIYWKMNGLQVPVVRTPAGFNSIPQVPLDIRLIRDADFQ